MKCWDLLSEFWRPQTLGGGRCRFGLNAVLPRVKLRESSLTIPAVSRCPGRAECSYKSPEMRRVDESFTIASAVMMRHRAYAAHQRRRFSFPMRSPSLSYLFSHRCGDERDRS